MYKRAHAYVIVCNVGKVTPTWSPQEEKKQVISPIHMKKTGGQVKVITRAALCGYMKEGVVQKGDKLSIDFPPKGRGRAFHS